jgi:choline dehydrogenase-like flavoprotein
MSNYEPGTDVDIVVAGGTWSVQNHYDMHPNSLLGGTAACVLAGRLQQADPSLSILIIEAGPSDYQNPCITVPGLCLLNTKLEPNRFLSYQSKANPHLAGRSSIVLTGGCLGGGSAVNFMMYTRAQGVDYDSFKTEGWTQRDLLPLLNKLETFHSDGRAFDMKLHGAKSSLCLARHLTKLTATGTSGPIHVSRGPFTSKRCEDEIMKTIKEIGDEEIDDLQDLTSNDGWSRWFRYISPDGKRQDAAHTYIHPLLRDGKHPNLHILAKTKVHRVIFDDNKRATGVEYIPNTTFQPSINPATHPVSTVKARKMVIVSAGTLGTPQILERSGIGNAKMLQNLSIPVVADVPGVGENYQDHHLSLYSYKTSLEPDETLDGINSGRVNAQQAMQLQNPVLGWNSIDVAAKIRPSKDAIAAFPPALKESWDRDFANQPERPLMLFAVLDGFIGDASLIPQGQYLCLAAFTAYPYSRGSIHITGPTITSLPDFDSGMLNDKGDVDLATQVWAYKKQREIMRLLSVYRGELAITHPTFPEGSKAAAVDLDADPNALHRSSNGKIEPIQYSLEDDKAIEEHIRKSVDTTFHSCGTAAMKPLEDGGVLDKNLNVYCVTGLKVAGEWFLIVGDFECL